LTEWTTRGGHAGHETGGRAAREVDEVLIEHPAVSLAAVIGVPHPSPASSSSLMRRVGGAIDEH
jgi:hypothetical protein